MTTATATAFKATVRITWDPTDLDAQMAVHGAFTYLSPFAHISGVNPSTPSARERAWGTASEPHKGTVTIEPGFCQFDCDEQAPLNLLKILDEYFPDARFRMLEISEAGLQCSPPIAAMGFAMRSDTQVEVAEVYGPLPDSTTTDELWEVAARGIEKQVNRSKKKPRGFGN
ncbi:hypothetical protein OAL13_00230 [bacterium]|nr:hypothetical protein [bacterium]